MELTEESYWENFWAQVTLPSTVETGLKNDKTIAKVIKKHVPLNGVIKTAAEIGCAPGKWLVWLNKTYGCKVTGYEYCAPALKATEENLALNKVQKSDYSVYLADFLKLETGDSFDCVVSLGFIEHFTDINPVFAKHVKIMAKNGYLVIGMPNYRGITYCMQKIIDRYLSDGKKILSSHNTKIMDKKVMANIAKEHDLNVLFSGYVGGFEPALLEVNNIKNGMLKFFVRAARKTFTLLLGGINTKITSGYYMLIAKGSGK